jgi:hypothetical protein
MGFNSAFKGLIATMLLQPAGHKVVYDNKALLLFSAK